MAKKNSTKKFDTPETNQEAQMEQQAEQETPSTNGEDTTSQTQFVAKPQFYLQDQNEHNGTQYQFTRFNMPKKAEKNPEGEIRVVINGVEHPAWLTSSKGWAADDARIDYIWLQLANGDKGYITLDYGVDAQSMADHEFEVKDGKANRENPKRVPRDPAKEESRKQQFSATMAKRAEQPAEGTEGQPAAEGEQPQQAA